MYEIQRSNDIQIVDTFLENPLISQKYFKYNKFKFINVNNVNKKCLYKILIDIIEYLINKFD